MRIKIPIISMTIGAVFGYLVISPFTMWVSHVIHMETPAYDMNVLYVLRPELFRWFLPFTLFAGMIGLFMGLLYLRIRERTDEKNAALKYNELVLNSMAEGMLTIGKDYKIVMANRSLLEASGYILEDVLGRPCHEVTHDFDRPCDSQYHMCPLTEVLEKGKIVNTTHIHRDKDGQELYVEITASPVRDEQGDIIQIIEIVRDVTIRVKAEEALRKSENKFRQLSQEFNGLLNAIPDVLALLGTDLKIVWANEGTMTKFGMDKTDSTGHYCYNLWQCQTNKCERCPVARSFKTGEPDSEQIVTPDQKLWDLRTFPLRDEEGRITRVIKVGRDITKHQKLEEQLHQSQKMEAVGQLAGGIAHDFNNILTAIIGYGSVLLMEMKEDNPLRADVEEILSASERATSLTNSLLAYSKKQIINLKPVKLNSIVADLVNMLTRIIGEDIELKTSYVSEDLAVMADSSQIVQILINLATNSRDAMPNGGMLTIETGFLKLDEDSLEMHKYKKTGEYGLIRFIDTGEGIAEENLDKIFDPFFTTKSSGRGTGLGLSMVYGIIEQHGGCMDVYSEIGTGTTFIIYLPLVKDKVEETEIIDSEAQPQGGTECILLAEDDEYVRNLIKKILAEAGYTVIEASDGEEAINKFMDQKNEIDIVILDVIMPKKNGQEVCNEILAVRPDAKILFISGYSAETIRQKGILTEKFDFMKKPILPNNLLSRMRKMLDTSPD